MSLNGGGPKWGWDNRLYYLGLDFKVMTTKLTLSSVAQVGPTTELFAAPRTADWAPSPDGKRFLFLVPQQHQDTPLTVVLNWQASLRK